MTRVTNVDHLVMILRQKLLERSKSASGQRVGATANTSSRPAEPTALEALSGVDGVDDGTMRRALIQDVLAEHFGRHLVNDANFQQVVDRVTASLEAEPTTSRMFSTAIGGLRAQR